MRDSLFFVYVRYRISPFGYIHCLAFICGLSHGRREYRIFRIYFLPATGI